MLKKTLLTTAFIISLASFQPALAESTTDLSKTESREKYKSMSPDERQKFHDQRKVKWDSMGKDEKLQIIEKRRAEKKSKMEEKWNSMSDDEKIGFVDKKMQNRGERAGQKVHGAKHSGDIGHGAE